MDTEKLDRTSHENRQGEMKTVSLEDIKLQDVDVDGVWHFLGKYGRYQVVQMLLLCICYAGMSLPIVHGIFVGKFVDFRCSTTDASFDVNSSPNQTVKISECQIKVMDNVTSRVLHEETCKDHVYEGGDTYLSYLAEWDLVCDKEVLGQLPQILLVVGQVFGACLIPPIGDKYGRKKLVMANVLGLFLMMLVSAFVQQFEFFLVLRFFIGAFIQGVMVAVGTMMLEVVPVELRSGVGLAQSSFWIVSLTFTGVVGYIFRYQDWRMLQIAYAMILGVPSIISLFFMNESLHWLFGNSRVKEATDILQKACRWNSKDYETLIDKIASDTTKELNSAEHNGNGNDVKANKD